MEPVLFYGVPQGCSFGSIVALEWLGQPYRLCRIEMLEQPWNPLYSRVNRLLQTPALLLEDGESLGQSLAILQHLAARDRDSGLGFPQGSRQLDRLNEMLAYLNTDFFYAFSPLWTLYEAQGLSREQAALLRERGEKGVRQQCAHLNQLLADRQWLLGEQRTVADAYLAGIGRWASYHRLFDMELDYPRLAGYLSRLADDPAVQFAHAVEQNPQIPPNGCFLGHVTLEELAPRLAA